jgi:DNA-binding CsgD family transcriptional regulator
MEIADREICDLNSDLRTHGVGQARPQRDQGLLRHLFSLTPAEAKLANLLVRGLSPDEAGEKPGVKRATARNQLKAIFAKTNTHRQGQLVALLATLSSR